MFSSNELITFVFANEGDTYYRDDLQKLELEQHLWYLLHESFDAVYFLREEDQQLTVDSFGDRKGSCPELKKSIFSSVEKQLRSWIPKALRRTPGEKGTAFVCRLQDFCNVMSQPQWEKTLREIKKLQDRSGIFVLIAPATAEKTTGLLLTSPVFEYLEETAITNLRGGELREMYDTLSREKQGSCFFFNRFTLENVYALLLHVVMEKQSRLESMEQLDKLSNYLCRQLNDPGVFSLFSFPYPGRYLTFKELYDQLCKESVWNQLVEKSKSFIEGGEPGRCIPILRESGSCARGCLQMKLPKWFVDSDGTYEKLLQEIKELASIPKNRLESSMIMRKGKKFLDFIGTVLEGDSETYITILHAMKFCAEYIYICQESDKYEKVNKILELFQQAIEESRNCYDLRQAICISNEKRTIGKLESISLNGLKKELQANELRNRMRADLIAASQLQLSKPDSQYVAETIKNLSEKLSDMRNGEQTPEAVEPSLLEPETEQKALKEKDLELSKSREKEEEETIPIDNSWFHYNPE